MDVLHYFSPDHATARGRFVAAAERAGAALFHLPLAPRAPGGDALGIDIAWLGERRPRRVLLHLSGLHGVEGFAGSAIQLHALSFPPTLAPDTALVLIHGLNPYGMAWLRRVNEANVDLNRNFPGADQTWQGASGAYRALDGFLNPPTPPGHDGFWWGVVKVIARQGHGAARQAVAQGQYAFPRGLFYGGARLEPEPARLLDWLTTELGGVQRLLAMDVHTGLGPWGRGTLFTEVLSGRDAPLPPSAQAPFYRATGSLTRALPGALPGVRVDALLQEFGTYIGPRVLHGLREENRWHHYGGGGLDHPTKRRLLELFCPAAPGWRRRVVDQGADLLDWGARVLR